MALISDNDWFKKTMKKSDCQDCQHLNRAYMWCRRHFRGIEDPEKEACEDFLPLLWELDYSKRKT